MASAPAGAAADCGEARRAAAGDGGSEVGRGGAAAPLGGSCSWRASLAVTVVTRNSMPLAALAAGVLAALARRLVVARARRARRVRAFEEQFPDCLEFISRSMRAGHAFSVALEMVYQEFSEPLAGEFRRAFEEQNLGQPLGHRAEEAGAARALAGRAVLRLGGAAAEAHRRQPGGAAGQAGATSFASASSCARASGRSARRG